MDDAQKQRLLVAIIAFNLTVLIFQVVFNMGMFGFAFTWGKLALAVVLGAVVGGGTYGAMQFLQR